jgi:hypothetical protein
MRLVYSPGDFPGARTREGRPMIPTMPPEYQTPDDEGYVRVPEVLDPSADDPDNWWLDLGRVEFPGLSAV